MDTININGIEVDLEYPGGTWATVGGRIEDFAHALNEDGPVAAYTAVREQYGREWRHVWNGLLVFVQFGRQAYYNRALQNWSVNKPRRR